MDEAFQEMVEQILERQKVVNTDKLKNSNSTSLKK